MPVFSPHLSQTVRRLARSPVFTLFSILTFALAIGATTAIYSVIRVVTGPPPGIPNVERMLEVYHFSEGSVPIVALSWEDYQDLRARQTAFDALTGWTFTPAALVAQGVSETNLAEIVDGDYFRTTRAPIVLGRALQPADDRPDAPPAVVISAAFWQRVFGGSRTAIGQTMKIAGATFEVAGVTGPEFQGLFNGGLAPTAVWVPMSHAGQVSPRFPEALAPDQRDRRWVMVRGRLAPGQSAAQARAQVQSIARQLDAAVPLGTNAERRAPWSTRGAWGVRPLGRVLGVPALVMRGLTWGVLAAVALVLLIACTNLANLMVARHTERQSATAIRRALGASRGRLIVEGMVEPLLLSVAGGFAALGVARVLTALFSTPLSINGLTLQALPRLDAPALGVAMSVTLLAALVAGAIPAWRATGPDLRAVLATGSAGAGIRWRGRRYLIIVQVAVSVLLVSLASLFIGQLQRQNVINPGVDLEQLAVMQMDFGAQQYDSIQSREMAERVVRQLERAPGVAAVSAMSGLPFGLNARNAVIQVPGVTAPSATGSQPRMVNPEPTPGRAGVSLVAGDSLVFDTLGVTLIEGRAFEVPEIGAPISEVVLSQIAAEQLFPEGRAVGRQLILTRQSVVGEPAPGADQLTVVGIASNTDAGGLGRRVNGVAYVPFDGGTLQRVLLVARTTADPGSLAGLMRRTLASLDPELAVGQTGSGMALAGPDTIFPRVVAGLAGSLGSLALVVALAGLYGVLSHLVGSRTREIGVRMALGASASRIRRMVIAEGLSPVALGLVAGLGLGAIARAAVAPVFQRLIPAADLTLLVTIPLLFGLAGLVACYLPARRAARVDPSVALRAE